MKISDLVNKYSTTQGEILGFLRSKGIAAGSADENIEEGAVKLVSDKFESKQNEKEEKMNQAADAGMENKKESGDNKSADGKKTVKKKKIIIVTGGNAQGGQRGAYSSGSGAYNPGQGGRNAGGARGGSQPRSGAAAGQGARGGRPQKSAEGRGERTGGRDGSGRPGQGGRGKAPAAAPVRKLIKPTIRQTQMEVDFHKPVQQPRKSDAVKKVDFPAIL